MTIFLNFHSYKLNWISAWSTVFLKITRSFSSQIFSGKVWVYLGQTLYAKIAYDFLYSKVHSDQAVSLATAEFPIETVIFQPFFGKLWREMTSSGRLYVATSL